MAFGPAVRRSGHVSTARPAACSSRPVPYRRRVAVPVLAALVAAGAAGCSGAAAGAPAASSGASPTRPVDGGALTYVVDTEPLSWDVHVSPQDVTGSLLRNVVDSLVHEDDRGTFHPWLASSWEIAPDLRTYTFHLRDGVTFSDGAAFDAGVVKANFDRIVAKETKSQYAASLLGPYAGTTVVDRLTARVTFSRPFAPFLQAASTAYLGFYSPTALKAGGAALGAGGPAEVGSGPFTVASYTKGQSLVLRRNPAYRWGPADAAHTGPAHLETLTVRFLPEDSVRVGALTSGQAQVADSIPPSSVKRITGNPALRLVERDAPGANYAVILNASRAPLDDPLVRRAIQRGIDIDTDVRTVYLGTYRRAWSVLSPSTPFYDRTLENSWPYDAALAGRLLDQAGWTSRDADGVRTKGGVRLSIDWPLLPAEYISEQRDILGQAIQADLKKIGVDVRRPRLDIGTYLTTVYGGKANAVDTSWGRFEADVLRLYFNSASTPATGGQNATFIKDADLDTWTSAAERTLDATARADAYARTQHKVIDLGLVVPLYVKTSRTATATSVRGLAKDPNTWVEFYDTWLAR